MSGGSGTGAVKVHRGSTRRYWCDEYLDENGKLSKLKQGCESALVANGEKIPNCRGHDRPMRLRRNLSPEERRYDAFHRAQFSIGSESYPVALVWADVAKREAKCHLCSGQIVRGERRVAFDHAPRYGGISLASGGVITRRRQYVHATCFVDIIMGGKPGEGCPGCSTKVLENEFRDVKKMLKERYAEGKAD